MGKGVVSCFLLFRSHVKEWEGEAGGGRVFCFDEGTQILDRTEIGGCLLLFELHFFGLRFS